MEKVSEFQPGLRNRAGIFSSVKRAEKADVIVMEFQPRLKSELGHAQWLCFAGNVHVAPGNLFTCHWIRMDGSFCSTKHAFCKRAADSCRFQWNKGNKIENLIRCLWIRIDPFVFICLVLQMFSQYLNKLPGIKIAPDSLLTLPAQLQIRHVNYCNKISATLFGWNFSPGWNSPWNRALNKER